jgi:formate dehydrogenase subunit gamma
VITEARRFPPVGKFNAGQKAYGLFMGIATVILGITGFIIWSPTSFSIGIVRVSLLRARSKA